jgi:hypothetical protein
MNDRNSALVGHFRRESLPDGTSTGDGGAINATLGSGQVDAISWPRRTFEQRLPKALNAAAERWLRPI